MPDLAELTRQYQAALEERRIRAAHYDNAPALPLEEWSANLKAVEAELAQAEAAMNAAWLERACA